MSLSVDDLVSSLNASHIGQEAMDLAALQAQLAQALFAQFPSSATNIPRKRSTHTQPCNTPTASSFSCHWNPSPSSTSWQDTADTDDERMVEELLLPSSPTPMSMASTPSSAYFPTSPAYDCHSPASATSSSFASTDPFYLAQLQAMSTPSLFAQAGRPNQASPFLLAQQQQQMQMQMQLQEEQQQRENAASNNNHHHGYHSNSLDAHTALFVKTGAAF